MKIYSVSTSLNDYPDMPCCNIAVAGCSMQCPTCYNKMLSNYQLVKEDDYINTYKSIKNLACYKICNAVNFTGGEVLINNKDTFLSLLDKIKEDNKLIKVDTNGLFLLDYTEEIKKGYFDYIAMDLKSISSNYSSYVKPDYLNYNVLSRIRSGIDILKKYMKGKHEFRIVSSLEFNDYDDIMCMVNSFLSKHKTEKLVINNYFGDDYKRLTQKTLEKLKRELMKYDIDNIIINNAQRKSEEHE